ncbi:hypothetical protein JTE90_009813 [Oedothorax gibbosus]|uniref:Uncharacterized protein n=1 Tax=Oedothorax gibbosus TaxID=931172 RepID=A0AAV6TME8_9ARAC|nr:hypothetical protein JTE90_009813 [Oedothorax gibbosus]
MLKIFETDLHIKGELIVSYTCFEGHGSETSLVLQLKNGSQLHLVGEDHNVSNIDEYCFPSSEEELLKKGYNKKKSCWTTRSYLLNHTEDNIQSIAVKCQPKRELTLGFDLLLTELEMIPLWPIYNLMHRNLTCHWDAAKTKVRVQCVLEWHYQTSVLYSDLYVEVPGGEKKYLATTSQLSFKLDRTFDNVESFNVVLSPKGALKEDLGSETMCVNIV